MILVGYQAEGTRGRRLLQREPEIKILGRYVPVKAEVANIDAFSVHADQGEIIKWLRDAAEKELGWKVAVARHLEGVPL